MHKKDSHVQLESNICEDCRGAGEIVLERIKLVKGWKKVTIPVLSGEIECGNGTTNTTTTKIIKGSGGAAPTDSTQSQPGDLYVNIKVQEEEPIFRREGADIHVDAVVSSKEVLFGKPIEVPTLTGNAVLQIRSDIENGDTVVLKGKGIKTTSKNNSDSIGDQYVHFKVTPY
ncbi:Chaperone DnaJ [Macleaya cordata]|uniref:Chaperone DnaJ n=1 Tax=Macleaya cordata TaxID=56857 RepID=A0A200PWT3_MACCD|nr:Chaperone DnaJ [Macleaya cordata]